MQTVLITLALAYCFKKLFVFLSNIRSIQNLAGYRVLISHSTALGYLLPRIPGVCRGNNHLFKDKHAPFASAGWDATSIVYAFPEEGPTIVLADAAAIKEVTSARTRFPKPTREYEFVSMYGRNIITAEGEEWKRYRKICAPTFSDRNNKLVWDETVQVMNGLFNEVWGGKDTISVDHTLELTLQLSLYVVGVAGFGQQMSWKENTIIPKGRQMSMRDALHVVSTGTIFKLVLPDWALKLTKRLRTIRLAFDELEMHMSEIIKERQISEKLERHDLFSNLVSANDGDLEAVNLSESELMGNIFIFLLAGHETAATTICFAFALLALYPDEQEKLYKHILSIIPDGRVPTYEDLPLLKYSLGVLNESLRMYPPVVGVPKLSEEDTTLTVGNANGETLTIPVPKGARMIIDIPGLHYNSRYWKDPHSFKPERFLEDWPRDAFLPFSSGPRSCIGRKFFETEGVAVLTTLVSRYKITVKEEPQFAGETFEQRKNRVLKCKNLLTLTPYRVPLTFTRRT